MTDHTPGYQRLFAELKRRRVFRVMAVYGIVGFVLLQIADLVVPALLLPEWTYRLVALILLLGFPVAIVLAWALEMTPGGLRRTAEATPGELTEIIAAPVSRRWSAGVLALVGVTALLAGVWYVGTQSAPASTADPTSAADLPAGPVSESIAVLPFVNRSSDPEQEYFSDGIADELGSLLARIPELQVAAQTSSFSFKGQNLDIREIADRLNVAHVLEGSVRRSGSEVRITAQLVRADDGFQMWSDTWDRSLDDIFAIQNEIAADVVEQLKVTLLGAAPTVAETDPQAYALFLQARQLSQQVTVESLEPSTALYQQALAIDPDYGPAWSGLAANYVHQAGFALGPVDEAYRLAQEAANRALAIDAEYAQAYANLGLIATSRDGDLAAAARHYERALEQDPTNRDILADAARLAAHLGRLDETLALQQYVVARDPVNSISHFRLGHSYHTAGRLDEALASYRTALRLSPARIGAHFSIGVVLLLKGELAAALAETQKEPFDAFRLIGLAMVYHALGQATESDAALTELIDKHAEGWAYNIAYVMAFRGEADRAFEWLDKAVQYNDAGLAEIPLEYLFANIHADPRWLPFLESIGKSPEQLAAIEFNVTLPK